MKDLDIRLRKAMKALRKPLRHMKGTHQRHRQHLNRGLTAILPRIFPKKAAAG